ncbi:MAG: 3-phosphoshikimate 1-carboxyvinyltransferase [Acidobacteriota bacterium]
MRVKPAAELRGRVDLPGDKSISHRFAILGAMARGRTRITNYSPSEDCRSTLRCLRELGVEMHVEADRIEMVSPGWDRLTAPAEDLDAGNSGTTMRLLSGLLAARPFVSRIGGDESLNRRPMRRIVEPLTRMGATIHCREGEYPPLEIHGALLNPIHYVLPVASAQVKSCVLLAGLTAPGQTTVVEPAPSRDHTERALHVFGVPVRRDGLGISVRGPVHLYGAVVHVPGDLSSASFLITATLLRPGSTLSLPRIGVNPTRDGYLRLLEESGAAIHRQYETRVSEEPVCDLEVAGSLDFVNDFPQRVAGKQIPNLIDEIPILAVLATQLPNGLEVRDAAELRKKESDRIDAVVGNLQAAGVAAEQFPDGFRVPYTPRIPGGSIRTCGDHRIAMAFAVLGLLSENGVELDEPDCVDISFPGFFEVLTRLTGHAMR